MMDLLEKVYDQENLSQEEMEKVAERLFSGQLADAQIGALLLALKIKGETPDEMAGLATYLHKAATPIPLSSSAGTMCNCGTGGDRSNSFNISTTSAFVLAASGIKVAKTGNRNISSKSGSFDTCEALDINFLLPTKALAEILDRVNIAFIYAPLVHPRMKYVMPARKSLGVPTIMNLIGPLTNPIDIDYQLMGTYRQDLLADTALAIQKLGRKRALVVTGADGMDEASLSGRNHYALLEEGNVTLHSFTPEDVGLPRYTQNQILGGGPKKNAGILKSVLSGEESPFYDTVRLNAGLGLFTAEKASSIIEGIQLAGELIKSGAAYQKLTDLLTVQKEVS